MHALRDAAFASVRLTKFAAVVLFAVLLTGCNGVQSALSPFGAEAESTRALTLVMVVAAAVITAAVLWLARHAVRSDAGIGYRGAMRTVFWLGGVVPTVLLTALLAASLPQMRTLPAADTDLTIIIGGEQFWWRVQYRGPGGADIETANEVRVPVGRTVRFEIESPDVIHSFWIPGLAGKIDAIPGRTNELVARATVPGIYRGVCAEFCGLSHAKMAFDVVAMEPAEFDAWLDDLGEDAQGAPGEGGRLFAAYGCAGCHRVRGHFPGSPIGPDLTHFGARLSLAAGALPMSLDAISRFIRDPSAYKPGVLMPAFRDMPVGDAEAIAAYLAELP